MQLSQPDWSICNQGRRGARRHRGGAHRNLIGVLGVTILVLAACTGSGSTSTSAVSEDSTAQATSTVPSETQPSSPSQPSTASTAPQVSGGELRVGKLDDFTTFDPWVVRSANLMVHRQIYDPLIYAQGSGEYSPALAEEWTIAADNTSVTFKLREGVMFHNGRALTAEDVVANFERAQDESIGHGLSVQAEVVESATVVGDLEVKVDLTTAVPGEVLNEFFSAMFIIAPEAMADVETTPVGTGPFQFVEWEPGNFAVFEKFDGYWREPGAFLDSIRFNVYSDTTAMQFAYEAGEIDLVYEAPGSSIPIYEALPDTEIITSPLAGSFNTFVTNVESDSLDDKLVRQALAHSVNREAMVSNVYFGVGEPVSTPFYNPELVFYNEALANPYPYDLQLAQSLFDEAGFDYGETVITVSAQSDPPARVQVAEILQADLATIGVQVEIQALENSTFVERWRSGNFRVASASTAVWLRDPSATFSNVAPLRADDDNAASYSDPHYQELARQAATELDPEARQDMYREMASILVEESFVIPIATNPYIYVASSDLTGLRWQPNYEYLILDETSLSG